MTEQEQRDAAIERAEAAEAQLKEAKELLSNASMAQPDTLLEAAHAVIRERDVSAKAWAHSLTLLTSVEARLKLAASVVEHARGYRCVVCDAEYGSPHAQKCALEAYDEAVNASKKDGIYKFYKMDPIPAGGHEWQVVRDNRSFASCTSEESTQAALRLLRL